MDVGDDVPPHVHPGHCVDFGILVLEDVVAGWKTCPTQCGGLTSSPAIVSYSSDKNPQPDASTRLFLYP